MSQVSFTLEEGWLSGARHLPSPHQNGRPNGEVSLLVVHGISLPPGEFGGPWIDDLFLGRLVRLSPVASQRAQHSARGVNDGF